MIHWAHVSAQLLCTHKTEWLVSRGTIYGRGAEWRWKFYRIVFYIYVSYPRSPEAVTRCHVKPVSLHNVNVPTASAANVCIHKYVTVVEVGLNSYARLRSLSEKFFHI